MKLNTRDRKAIVKGCQWGGMVVRPDTVAALIVMKTAEGYNVRDTLEACEKTDLFSDWTFANACRYDSISGIVEEVHHIDIAVAEKFKKKAAVCLPNYSFDPTSPSAIGGIVQVDDQCSSDIDQKDSVLKVVGDAINPDVVAQLCPCAVGEHGNVE